MAVFSLKNKTLQFETFDTHEGITTKAITPHAPLFLQTEKLSDQSIWDLFFFAFLAKNNLARHINEYSTGGFEAWLEISEVKE